MIAIEARDIEISFGGNKAVDRVSFSAQPGKILSIIGPNGAGKTTLFNVVSGVYKADKGAVLIKGEDVSGFSSPELAKRGLSRTFQNLQIFDQMTVLSNVMVGRHLHERRALLPHLLALPSVTTQNELSRARALELLAFVNLVKEADAIAGGLSYGALKRLEIARALAAEPLVLLLDEPAAGCNPKETSEMATLIRSIADRGVAVVLVEHDMRLVMKISDDILVMASGKRLAYGLPHAIRRDPTVIAAYLGPEIQKASHVES